MNDVVVSRHAKKRLKQRVHKNWQKAANLAFHYGVEHGGTTGKLRKHIDRLARNGYRYQVYNEHIYLFDHRDVLITVMHLPGKLASTGRRLTKKRNRRRPVPAVA